MRNCSASTKNQNDLTQIMLFDQETHAKLAPSSSLQAYGQPTFNIANYYHQVEEQKFDDNIIE